MEAIQKAKREAERYIGMMDNDSYYKGIVAALDWISGKRKTLFSARERNQLQRRYEYLLRNKLD